MGIVMSEQGCNGDCNQGRDCVCRATDAELGIAPPPPAWRWDIVALWLGSAALVVTPIVWLLLLVAA